jgi:hypothetical protein
MVEQIAPEGKIADRRHFRLLQETTDNWRYLSFYSRFEQVAALILTVLVSCVIVVAILDLIIAVARDLFIGGLAPVDHAVFQAIFGMIMTVLIAMEFNHTILSILDRKKKHCSAENRNPHIVARHGAKIHHHRRYSAAAHGYYRSRLCRIGARLRLLAGARTRSARGRGRIA